MMKESHQPPRERGGESLDIYRIAVREKESGPPSLSVSLPVPARRSARARNFQQCNISSCLPFPPPRVNFLPSVLFARTAALSHIAFTAIAALPDPESRSRVI